LANPGYSRWLSHGIYSLLDKIGLVFFGFLNVMCMARMMSESDLGTWVLFTSVTAFLEMIRNGFIRNPFITHLVSADLHEKKYIVTASVVLHCILSAVITAFLFGGGIFMADFWNEPELVSLFFIYGINNLIFIPYHHFEYIQHAQLKFKGIFFSNVFRLGLFAVYVLVYFILYELKISDAPSLVELAIAQTVATFLGCFVAYYFIKGTIEFSNKNDWKLTKELLHFGKFTLGTNVSSMFVKNTDSWMIGRMISSAAVADYNPAIRISNLVEVPTLTIANIFFPQVAQRLKERGTEGVRDIYVKSVSIILALTIPMVLPFYIFPELAITLIFGPNYADSADILRVTLFYTMIIPFNRQFGTVMDGIKKPKLNFYLLVLVAVLNVIFNLIFLKQFGLIGSAYATLLSYCVVFLLNQIILYRMFGINTFSVFTGIIEWYKVGWDIFRKKVLKMA
jgi:lipopolysaccharide exporter